MTDRRALLALLLSSTGLSQTEAARYLHVEDRTVRRWLNGDRETPEDAIADLALLSAKLDRDAEQEIKLLDEQPKSERVRLLIYRRDDDLPGWTGLPTASCYLAMMRRIFAARPERVTAVAFEREAYRRWLNGRKDTQAMRDTFAIAHD